MSNTNELRNYAIQLSREVIALRKEIKALKNKAIDTMYDEYDNPDIDELKRNTGF